MPRICVIGGGLIGLLSALRLRQRGLEVCVVERGEAGREASWAAAGILAPLIEEHGLPLRESVASRNAYPVLVAELEAITGTRVAYAKSGAETLFPPHEQDAIVVRARRMGEPVERRGDRVWLPNEAWVDARALTRVVAEACRRLGVVIREGTSAEAVETGGVRLGGGEQIAAERIVVAAGAWSNDVGGLNELNVEPVKGVLLRVRTSAVSHVVYWQGGYAVPRPNGEAIVGATLERLGFDKSVTEAECERVLRAAQKMLPALQGAVITERWAGLRPASVDGELWLRPSQKHARVLYATGHFRNGVLYAPVTADWVSANAHSGK